MLTFVLVLQKQWWVKLLRPQREPWQRSQIVLIIVFFTDNKKKKVPVSLMNIFNEEKLMESSKSQPSSTLLCCIIKDSACLIEKHLGDCLNHRLNQPLIDA